MSKHYLVINHESYDSSTVFGVFDTFVEARDQIEEECGKPRHASSAENAEIEEWDGGKQTANYDRSFRAPRMWNEHRYG